MSARTRKYLMFKGLLIKFNLSFIKELQYETIVAFHQSRLLIRLRAGRSIIHLHLVKDEEDNNEDEVHNLGPHQRKHSSSSVLF